MILFSLISTMATTKQDTQPQGKRTLYLCCTVLLCLLLLTIIYELSITAYINYAIAHNSVPTQVALFKIVWFLGGVGGILGGIALGKYWWRIVYIENRHWKHYFRKYMARN